MAWVPVALSVGGTVLKTVIEQFGNQPKPQREEPSKTNTYRVQEEPIYHSRPSFTTATPQKCNNCNGEPRRDDKQSVKPKPKENDRNYHTIRVPRNGNFEINIRRKEEGQNRRPNTQSFTSGGSNNNPGKRPMNQQKASNNFQQKGSTNQRKSSNDNQCGSKTAQKFSSNHHRPQVVNIIYQTGPSQNTFGQDANKFNMPGGVKSKTWMYLGRVKKGTNTSAIMDFLKEMFPGYQFKVEYLPLYKDGKLPSFKVLVDDDILSSFQTCWPCGVVVKKYIHNFKP